MRAMSVRIPLVLMCLGLVVSLSGPGPTMAKEKEQEAGMIQCLASSRDAVMSMQFPAAGGTVKGQYIVSFTAHDTSPLYDQDGSFDYYDEDRTTNMMVDFSGNYAGGEEGSFSGLRVSGWATVGIDNLEDDRFDRSYRAEMDSPAAAVWGPGGSLTITGITGTFRVVSVNANVIPNTAWDEAQVGHFPDPTMICSPAPEAQTLEDISCTISTDPTDLGARDTTFQANITAIGFDPGATLSYKWMLNSGVSTDTAMWAEEGANPTISWRETAFADGYYTLQGTVTDGGHNAYCFVHFSIGNVLPNNPPECLKVEILPLAPQPGDSVVWVLATARDADGDQLRSVFELMRGFERQAPIVVGRDQVSLGNFQIPGGLQPGSYTVAVTIEDGKQWVICYYQFIVPPFPGGGEAGGCGPVGILYLDDYDIEPNPLAIDAAIEAALAQGGADYSLIVSHRQRLIDKFGQEGFEQIDGLLNNMRNLAETCPFLLIVGDHDVVPFAVLPNPADDGDVLFTDDVYGDTDHDALTMPDIPVARIPDGGSLELLVTQLSASTVPEGGDFTLANTKRPHADGVATQVFGANRGLFWSLPTRHMDVDESQVDVRYSYFMLHGASWDTTVWWGEEDAYPDAFTVAEASSQGIVLSGACYGSYTFSRTPENSITLSFLHSGARAFVGSTGITYSPVWEQGPNPTGPMRFDAAFHQAFLSALTRGQAPLTAFMEAKQKMADVCGTGDSTAAELKMLHEFIYFGKP